MPKCLVLRHDPNQPAPPRSSQDRIGQGDQLPSTSSNTANTQRFADLNQPKASTSKNAEKPSQPRDQNRPDSQINDLYSTEKDAENAAKSFADKFSRRGDRFSCKSNDLIPCSPCTAWFKISLEGGKYRLIGDLHHTCNVHSPIRDDPNQPNPTAGKSGQGEQRPTTSSNATDQQTFSDRNQPKASTSKNGEKQTPTRDQNRPDSQINDLFNTEKDALDAAESFADKFNRRGNGFSCKSNDLISCSPCLAWFRISREGGKYRLSGDLHHTCNVHSPIRDDPNQPTPTAGKSGQENQRPTTSSNATDQQTFSDWNQPKSSASETGKNRTPNTSSTNPFAGGFTGGLAGEAQANFEQFVNNQGTKQNAGSQSKGQERPDSLINDLYSTKQDAEDAADFLSDTFQRKGDRFSCKINEFIPNKCPAWFRIGKEGKDYRIKGNIRHTCNVDSPIRNDSESSENDQSEFVEEPGIQPNQKNTDHDSDMHRDEANHLGGEAQAASEESANYQGNQQNSARQSDIFDDEEAALLQSFKDLNGNPSAQEPQVNESGENHEETITFVEGDPAKTCLICQEVFTTPFLLRRHQGGKKLCQNQPCHDQRHPINDHFMIPFLTQEEADNYLSRFCKRAAMHKLTCKKEYACRMSRAKGINCTSKLRVKTGHRMGSDGKIHKVYIATGCNFHLHGLEIPIYGLDIILDFLSKLGMKAHLLNIFIFSYNHNIVRPTKMINDF